MAIEVGPPPRIVTDPKLPDWLYRLWRWSVESAAESQAGGVSDNQVVYSNAGILTGSQNLIWNDTVFRVGSTDGTGDIGSVVGYSDLGTITHASAAANAWWDGFEFYSKNRTFKTRTTKRNSGSFDWDTSLDAFNEVAPTTDWEVVTDTSIGIYGATYGSGSYNVGSLYGLYYEAINFATASAGPIDPVITGAYIAAMNRGVDPDYSDVARITAVHGDSLHYGGTGSDIGGVLGYASVLGGSMTNQTAGSFHVYSYTGTPTITNVYGMRVESHLQTGTITNAYGVYIGNPEPGATITNDWGFYQADARKNSFGGTLTIANGTVTVSAPLLDLSQTWNSSGVTFTGLKLNITDTASAAGSKHFDIQKDSTSIFWHEEQTTYNHLLGHRNAQGYQVYFGSLNNSINVMSFFDSGPTEKVRFNMHGGNERLWMVSAYLGFGSTSSPTIGLYATGNEVQSNDQSGNLRDFKARTFLGGGGATITTNLPMFDGTVTWNSGAVTFTGIRANVTDSASASASTLIDLQVGSTTQFSVTKAGVGYFAGDLGVGVTPVTTSFLKVGAATTAKSSLMVPPGTAPTSPVEGDLWYDGTNLKFQDSTTTRTINWT